MSPSTKTGKHLWISFDLGIVSGVMRSSGPPSMTNTPLEFTWRGTEAGEGIMTFQDCNVASLVFLGDGKIKGTISGDLFQDIEFAGKRNAEKSKNVVFQKYVASWKEEYRGINWRSYEAANVARWGKWVDPTGCEGRPEDSDTTDGGKGSDEDEEEGDYYGDESYDDGVQLAL